jgi:hypothetical protein
MFPVPAHFLDLGDFSGGFDFRCHFVKTELLGNGVGSTAVVAGKHDDLQPERVEFADGFDRGGFDRAGDGDDASRLAIYRNQTQRACLLEVSRPRPPGQQNRDDRHPASAGRRQSRARHSEPHATSRPDTLQLKSTMIGCAPDASGRIRYCFSPVN